MKLMYFQFSSHLLLFAWRLPPPTGKKDFFRRGYDDDDDDDDNVGGKNGDVEEEKILFGVYLLRQERGNLSKIWESKNV